MQELSDLELPIVGIHCDTCALRIEHALRGLPGVEKVRVNAV